MAENAQVQGRRFKTIATLAARAADDKKADDIRLLHVRPISEIADYLLIVNATSPAHMGAIEENIRVELKKAGENIHRRDGRRSDVWRVLDYGGLLVHIMHPKARDFYALDKLFRDAREVRWLGKPAPATEAAPRKSAKKSASKKTSGASKARRKRA